MNELLRKLNKEIVINDLIVKKMKYEINMLFYDYPSKEKANMLATKINGQLDASLKGISYEDKESIRKLIILNSFLVLPNPVSEHINYGHVFTTLTNYDDQEVDTKVRLMQWLDDNTEISYEESSLTQYIKQYKIIESGKTVRTAATTYEPTYKRRSIGEETKTRQKPIDDAVYKYRLKRQVIWIPITIILIIIMYGFMTSPLYETKDDNMEFIEPELFDDTLINSLDGLLEDVLKVNIRIIPDEYKYQSFHLKSVYAYLDDKNSMLVEDNYLSTINRLSEKYYVNPLLLIAIIGQEQGFVPRDHEYANEIINNPYNVFGSWIDYNTHFEESTIICLNTITTALESRPEGKDLIEFLNKKYSEDKNWSVGVKYFYTALQSLN